MASSFKAYSQFLRSLSRHPLLQSITITTAGFGGSDLFCQYIEYKRSKKEMNNYNKFIWDRNRTLKFSTIGFLFGPQFHLWIPFVVRLIPGHGTKIALQRVIFDCGIFGSWASSFVLTMNSLFEGGGINEIKSNIKTNWFNVYRTSLCIFVPGQFINFLLIPVKYRVLWLNSVGSCWRILLSYLVYGKHKDAQTRKT